MRRKRGDLIQKFKIEKGYDLVNWHSQPFCGQARGGHRGHYIRERVKGCNPRHWFFNNRICASWNSLPDEIVNTRSVNAFKEKLDSSFKLI